MDCVQTRGTTEHAHRQSIDTLEVCCTDLKVHHATFHRSPNVQRGLIQPLLQRQTREVHVRISSPPVKWPCFYGIDFASRAELIANGLAIDEIRDSIGADSLSYVSLSELTEATQLPAAELCRACFDGRYPVPLPEPQRLGKDLLEVWGVDELRATVPDATPTDDPEPVADSVRAGAHQ